MTLPPLSPSPLSLPPDRPSAVGALSRPWPDAASGHGGQLADQGRAPATAVPVDPGWLEAYLRLRAETPLEREPTPEPLPPVWPAALPLPALPPAPVRPEPAAVTPATPTAQRLDAVRRLAEPAPAAAPLARVWQVELPGAAPGAEPGWQLRIEQPQPLAPLSLTLQVHAQAQPLARQQLADLDRRLRLAGHDILRARCHDGTPRAPGALPVDEVGA